jgi:hypothetical protein
MGHLSFYRYKIQPFDFRISKLKKDGWGAKVQMMDDRKWKSVVFPTGQPVHCPTKKQMIAYIRFAYAGVEESDS